MANVLYLIVGVLLVGGLALLFAIAVACGIAALRDRLKDDEAGQ